MSRAARQCPEPLSPDVLRLVEGIALTLAQEHHAAELRGKELPKGGEERLDMMSEGTLTREAGRL